MQPWLQKKNEELPSEENSLIRQKMNWINVEKYFKCKKKKKLSDRIRIIIEIRYQYQTRDDISCFFYRYIFIIFLK